MASNKTAFVLIVYSQVYLVKFTVNCAFSMIAVALFSIERMWLMNRVSIIPAKNNSGGLIFLRNSLFNGDSRKFMEFSYLIPAE